MVTYLQKLDDLSPLGYGIGLHIRFASPMFYRSTFPEDWQDLYNKNSYQLRDPLVFWGISTTGQTRWSEITLPDPFGLLDLAAKHGLTYGATVSCGKITSRTLVGVARGDREFTETEIDEVADITNTLHEIGAPADDLTPAMIEALRLLGNGHRHTAAAAKIGISESALKARLSSAREKLGARTTAEALRMAREYRLI
ncbi:MAG: autoinducer binding domain-containing protein [Pseudomonadota bacterium]